MPIPTAALAIPAIGTAITSLFAQKGANTNAKRQAQLEEERLRLQKAQGDRSAALEESTLDPWRHSMFQADNIAKLDRLERGSLTPTSFQLPGAYAQYAPQRSGGFSYTKSPELIEAAKALKQVVMSGQGAPTMTDPANHGETGAIDILSILAGLKTPANARVSKPRSGVASAQDIKEMLAAERAWA